jgi:hypothetical protein
MVVRLQAEVTPASASLEHERAHAGSLPRVRGSVRAPLADSVDQAHAALRKLLNLP